MKKRVKKLRLSKETVRILEGPGLEYAVAGGDTIETNNTCTCTLCQSVTCAYTCGGNSNRVACKDP